MWAALRVSPVGARLLQLITIVAVIARVSCQECPAVVKDSAYPPEVVTPNDLCLMRKGDFSKTSSPTKIAVSGFWGGDPYTVEDMCSEDKMDCSRISLTMDGATCACRKMSINKGAVAADELSMHLDFESCTSGPSMAVVNMAIKKVPDAEMLGSGSLKEYFSAVCSKPTTTQISSIVTVNTDAKETAIGAGSCSGEISQSLTKADAPDRSTCENVCLGLIEKFSAMSDATDQTESCTGYAFSEDATDNVCLIYNTAFTDLSDSPPAGSWHCWTMSGQGSMQESTPAPVDLKALSEAALAKIPKLGFNVTASMAKVEVVSSKLADCFDTYSWIDLQAGLDGSATGYVPIKESEWDDFLSYVPSSAAVATASPATDAVGCKMAVGKIFYGGEGGSAEAVHVVAAQPMSADACMSQYGLQAREAASGGVQECGPAEYINAAITAVVVPLLVWIVVYILFVNFFKDASKPARETDASKPAREAPAGFPGATPLAAHEGGCEQHVVLILVLVVAVVAGMAASLLAHLLGFLLMGICPASSNDMNLITECVSVATFFGVAAGIWYISKLGSSKPSAADDNFKYKIIKVNKDNNQTVMESVLEGF